jgi:hypothetical protein
MTQVKHEVISEKAYALCIVVINRNRLLLSKRKELSYEGTADKMHYK